MSGDLLPAAAQRAKAEMLASLNIYSMRFLDVMGLEAEGIMFMKKKSVFAVIIIIGLIAAASYLLQPQNIINDINRYTIYGVVYNGEDVTERVDCNTLASMVSKYTCSRLPHFFHHINNHRL